MLTARYQTSRELATLHMRRWNLWLHLRKPLEKIKKTAVIPVSTSGSYGAVKEGGSRLRRADEDSGVPSHLGEHELDVDAVKDKGHFDPPKEESLRSATCIEVDSECIFKENRIANLRQPRVRPVPVIDRNLDTLGSEAPQPSKF